jgi:hypothetical protein
MQPDRREQPPAEPRQPPLDSDLVTGPEAFLVQLRREFPHWGILAGVFGKPWRAVQGARVEITAADGITLRENLRAATQHDRRTR